ncbi:MAG: S9 family peptidase [Planctomycetes bacterium]|nr:S9 family peptidase [Planctomycetota bacterium]
MHTTRPAAVFFFPLLLLVACASRPEAASPQASAAGRAAGALRAAGVQPITFESLFGSGSEKVAYGGTPAPASTWLDATSWLTTRTDPATKAVVRERVDARTGAATPHQPAAALQAALRAIPGTDDDEARRLAVDAGAARDRQSEAQLVLKDRDLWLARAGAASALRLTTTPDVAEEELSFSPDGARVAFVAANDLWVADARTGAATRLTQDGSENVLNGKLDWVYQEELYGRGNFRGYWWSPDARTLAYLRLDQSRVPRYTLVEDGSYRPRLEVEVFPYPRAGEPNPTVALRLVDVASGTTRDVDLGRWKEAEPLIVNVHWSPSGRLHYQVQDREQRWLELRAADADAGGDELLVRETTPAWVDRGEVLEFLDDGSFLWASERTGWRHLYRYRGPLLLNAVTSGEWEVRTVHGVDPRSGRVFFSGTERSPIGLDAYSVKLDGSGLVRLTSRPGTHAVKFNPDFTLFEDTWSDAGTPPQRRLHRAEDGLELRVVDANPAPALRERGFQRPEFLQVRARDGFVMEAMRILPPGYEPGRRYPVMVFGYWGPHAQTVKDAWGGVSGLFQQLLAQQGVVVWSCDGRTSSGKGAVSTWNCYQRLGEVELEDLVDGVRWLVDAGLADPERIGITGWSYGGFQTAFALAKTKLFRLGIAGGSVTDWRNYDSIYTERFMRTPQNNVAGYERTSVVAAAKDVTGRLVLVHGAIDDNVHPANTMQLALALQKAGKQFDLMLYPGVRHGPTGAASVHWRALQLESIQRWLLGP